jgi:hypothetical protein
MTMLKPALCAAALVAAAAIAIPAIAQQAPQGDAPSATQPTPAPQAGPDGRPGWRGGPRDRYSDEDGRGWRRRDEGRRFGRDEDEGRGRRERRFGGPRDGAMPPMMERGAMMRPFGMAHVCGPEGARISEMMIDRVERATQPTTEQRPGFDKLKEAAGKAGEIMRGACTTERPVTPTGRLAAAEKRLAATLEAVRTVRPAMDAYYGSLTDEQKARFTLAHQHMRPGMGGGWHERLNRWRDRMHGNEPRGDRTENTQPGADSEKL